MFRTIKIAGTISAQGIVVRDHSDGRVTIDTGVQLLTGWPVRRMIRGALAALVLGLGFLASHPQAASAQTPRNLSHDPMRALHQEVDAAFREF